MNDIMHRFFKIALCNNSHSIAPDVDNASFETIHKLAKKHDLAHLLGVAFKVTGQTVAKENEKLLESEINSAKFRYLRINHEIQAITELFERVGIRFILLKGAAIRKYYKEPWHRTSCDIDILISPDDVEMAKTVLVSELNFTYESSWNYEHSFHTPANVLVELHHTLSDDDKRIDSVLGEVWNRAYISLDCKFRYEMTDEMYYLYHIAHMAKHFVNGGCGIRPFIDIWVLNRNSEFDKTKRYELLGRAGLLSFAKSCEELSEVWFDNKKHNELSLKMERFILSGGIYGTVETRVAVQQAITGGKFSYIISRIFLPYNQLKLTYPNLEKHKWLFPLYQIKRWFRILKKGKSRKMLNEVKAAASVTEKEQNDTAELLKELGLK